MDGEVVDKAEEREPDVHKEVQIELEVGDVWAHLGIFEVRGHLEDQDQTDVQSQGIALDYLNVLCIIWSD